MQNLEAVLRERSDNNNGDNNNGDAKRYNDIFIDADIHIRQIKFKYQQVDSLVTLSSTTSLDESKRSRAIGILRTRALVSAVLVICVQDVTLAVSSKRNSARYAKDIEFGVANMLLENPPTFGGQSPNQVPDMVITVRV